MKDMEEEKRPSKTYLRRLALHASGMTVLEIAAEELVSDHTVAMSFRRLKEQLGARNLDHAVVLSISRGYLAIDSDHEALFVPEMSVNEILVAS